MGNRKVGLIRQHQFLVASTRDPQLSRCDLAVLTEISELYRDDKGDAWSSYAHLAAMVGVTERNVQRSISRLTERGWLGVTRRGNRGQVSAFVPNYAAAADYRTNLSANSMPDENVVSSPNDPTEMSAVFRNDPTGMSTDSYLPSPADKTADGKGRKIDDPTGLAPTAGLAAAEGRPVGFEQVYKAYGLRTKRAEAKAAFAALAPDAATLEQMIAAAERWRAAYGAIQDPTFDRMTLARWLRDECWLEDPPQSRRRPSVPQPNNSAVRVGTITLAETAREDRDLVLTITDVSGLRFNRTARCLDAEGNWTAAGQRQVAELMRACGLDGTDLSDFDTALVAGRSIAVETLKNGELSFSGVN